MNGVQLTREGDDHFTWDPVLEQAPNRPGRRWGTSRLVTTVLAVLALFDGVQDRGKPGKARMFGPRLGGRKVGMGGGVAQGDGKLRPDAPGL